MHDRDHEIHMAPCASREGYDCDCADWSLDFGMLDLLGRPGPCKAASAPERDPVEVRVLADRAAAQHRAEALRARGAKGAE